MEIAFTEEEYRKLMTLVLMGEWMVNAIQKTPDPAYEDLAQKVYGFARGTALERHVVFDEFEGTWSPSEAFEKDAHALIDEYDDKTFWEELTSRLAERDLMAARGERAVGAMRPAERTREAAKVAKAYTKEFEEHGIDRLGFAD